MPQSLRAIDARATDKMESAVTIHVISFNAVNPWMLRFPGALIIFLMKIKNKNKYTKNTHIKHPSLRISWLLTASLSEILSRNMRDGTLVSVIDKTRNGLSPFRAGVSLLRSDWDKQEDAVSELHDDILMTSLRDAMREEMWREARISAGTANAL